ncbi:fungal-specific transcription factor domain-containing protein [Aspergillus unguis]
MPLKRAKQACTHCHARRIRCDVLQQRPCSNCLAQEVSCQVGVSRRGKYPRKKAVKDTAASIPVPAQPQPLPQQHSLPIQQPIDKRNESTVFLGESSPLTSVMDPSKPPRLHYPLPDRLAPTSTRDEAVRLHQVQQAAQLESNGALSFPPQETVDALLQAYFTWFHPCFPIVDKPALIQSKNQGTLPPLLLQAMLFIGVSLCTDVTFSQTEFPVRYRAKFLFYSRAKSIYEADAEANPIVKLQALFMLSFWRGGPSEERDVRFWLGIAISLAQKRGMHMMSKFSPPPRERRLWKRIWWALYTRDQQSAAALGLPPRIRDEDGDVAMLEADDIREEPTEAFGCQTAQELVYPVEMAKLARLLRTIVSTQYLHHQRPDLATRNALNEQLAIWESNLPSELRLESVSEDKLFLTGLLHMTYQNLYILLHRRTFLDPAPTDSDNGQIALDAATKSTRIMEDLLSHHLAQHAPPHLITHAFTTLCIHTIHHRRSSGTMRTLAEHRARMCLLALEELQKSWDLENWVLHLFLKGLDDRTAAVLGLSQGNTPSQSQSQGQDYQELSTDTVGGTGTADAEEGHVPDLPGGGVDQTLMPLPIPLSQDDMYGWVPWEDEADALNLQNLEFLYRFL